MAAPLLNPLGRRPARDGIPFLRGSFPTVGHLPAMAGGLLELFRVGEREAGPLFWVDIGFGKQVLCFAHPSALDLFKDPAVSSAYIADGPAELLGTRSVIALDGPPHTRLRGALNPIFSPAGVTGLELGPAFADLITERVATWRGRGEIRLLAETRELVLSLMFRMLGISTTDLPQWRHHYERTTYLVLKTPNVPGTPYWFGLRSKLWLEGRIRELLVAARSKPTSGLLAALVGAKDTAGRPIDDDTLIDNLRLLLLAGHETSASTMAWATAVCATRSDVWRGLCDEALAAGGVPRTPADLKAFPYAEAVFREALRLFPPVPMDQRRTLAPLELASRSIPIGTDVILPLVHLSRDPAMYPDPDRFDPTRWTTKRTPVSPAERSQFGGGAHFCLGYHVAWLEIVQYLVALARTLGHDSPPRLSGAFPRPRYLPLLHPGGDPRVRVC